MAKERSVDIDDKELEKAHELAETDSEGTYTHKMSKTFTYEEKTYTELVFNWNGLTGEDSLAIENELAALGKPVIVPEFSGEYLIRMASRACVPPVGSDVLRAMPLPDFNKIRGKARSFLLASGQ